MSHDDWTGERVKVHRLEVLVIDHDDIGSDEVASVLQNARYPNRCISPEVMSVESREVDWRDSHPLNMRGQTEEAFRELFGHGTEVEGECSKRLPGHGVKCHRVEGHEGLHQAVWMKGDAQVIWKDEGDS